MIRSIFKMIWHRRKSSRMMLFEMFFSFMLLFALSSTFLKIIGNRFIPLGFDYKDVWILYLNSSTNSIDNSAAEDDPYASSEIIRLLEDGIKSMPEVISLSGNIYNIPYNNIYRSDIKYGDKTCFNVTYNTTDETFPEVMNVKLSDGRWFESNDAGIKETSIVINKALKNELFEDDESAINKVIQSGLYRVIGVVENFKINGDFSEETPHFFIMMKPDEIPWQLLIKSNPQAGENFRVELENLASSLAKEWTFSASNLSDFRDRIIRTDFMPVMVISIISLFLIINILMGLMGLLWYNINKRKSEIGLRKSVGAPNGQITKQLIIEMLVLSSLGIFPGLIIAIQFPLVRAFNIGPGIYILAIITSIVLLYLLVTIFTLIPTTIAAKIKPSETLHEE